eukprot:9349192-Ditylum_brightwellii.AAC.1
MGFHRSTPKAIVFATSKFLGVSLLLPKCEQLGAKINYVLQHIRSDRSIGLSIAIMLRWAQVCTGTSIHILRDTRPIPHLEGRWVKLLREGMNYIRAELQHKYKWVEPGQRVHDEHIMDVFLDSKEVEVE